MQALVLEVIADGAGHAWIGKIVRGIGRHRPVAARELVLALRTGLDALQSARDAEFDRLVIADFEMQEWVLLDRTPVAAVERVVADKIQRPGDVVPSAFGDNQQDAIGKRFADHREEFTIEIRPAPFARAGVHVEGEERIPMCFGNVAAGDPFDADAVVQRGFALFADGLALTRGEIGEERLEARISRIEEMELLSSALQKTGFPERAPFLGRWEGDVNRRRTRLLA